MMNSNPTPMIRQYFELKREHPGTLLFFRLGDFYELFFDDALTGSRELEITLTARHKERGEPIPMCGVPHHAAAGHIARLVRKGYRVAICEQTETPTKTKKLVRREVVRIITPGTAIDPQLLETREAIYLAAVCGSGDRMAAAFLDLSTGEFRSTEAAGADAWTRIRSDIEAFAPRELLFPASLAALIENPESHRAHTAPLPLKKKIAEGDSPALSDSDDDDVRESQDERNAVRPFAGIALVALDDWQWNFEGCASLLCEQFGVRELAGYGLEEKMEAVRAAGVCLRYARETQRAAAAHVTDIEYFEPRDYLVLDGVTVRNLELTETQTAVTAGASRSRSLFDVIDETVTGMGSRLLRSWLLRPSVRRGEIEARHASVAELHSSHIKREQVRALLKKVSDLERLTARLNMGQASPRDLVSLSSSLSQVPRVRELLADSDSSLLQILFENADELEDVRELITSAINEDAPAKLGDGDAVRDGYSAELDELRAVSRNAKQTIATLEARERTRSGINSLRIRYNNVFGYFIEVSRAASARVPSDYERRQTLSNAERFTTPELKSWESRVLGAEDRIRQIETEIFSEVCSKITAETRRIQTTARALAMLDALTGLAEAAVNRRYTQPVMHDGDEIEIIAGRHPVIEAVSTEQFIPNDLYMNNSTDRMLVITGPNMGGKSTVLRQTAIISILAQMGSFVPADRARLPILDRVWTRVGASDDLARGRSTFMVEMTETAAILHNATPRSLVLLDEIGRGTATFDGLSIAWAVVEHLHDSPEHAAKTLFATHYHELTELAERLSGARNYQITAMEREGEVIFLHRLEKGRASKSYGIEVARLAGLPPSVLSRAREVLERLERYELDVFAEEAQSSDAAAQQKNVDEETAETDTGLKSAARRARSRRIAAQATLFDATNQSLIDELREVNVEALSPDEARDLLRGLRKKIV
ncbi:MAG: DNA mismatch repair protein MutS [Pyrinomonadaceae bacterium]|nr:DNA mismatch repair protein MutS [Pyrinomonadaceae bacterium]